MENNRKPIKTFKLLHDIYLHRKLKIKLFLLPKEQNIIYSYKGEGLKTISQKCILLLIITESQHGIIYQIFLKE